jgi:hypothetical protein
MQASPEKRRYLTGEVLAPDMSGQGCICLPHGLDYEGIFPIGIAGTRG